MFAPGPELGREELAPSCPNPLFLQWLVEWRDTAAERQHKSQIVYEKAIRSLTMYPLPLHSGREAKILYGFGDGICNRLDEKLSEYYTEHGTNAPIHYTYNPLLTTQAQYRTKLGSPAKVPRCRAAESVSEEDDAAEPRPSPSKRRRPENREEQEYKPQKRSGGYALLLTFYREAKKPNYRGFMTKAELQRKAQPLCRISFTHFKASYRYNAWSAISALIQKDLVIKTGFPASGASHRKRELVTELKRSQIEFDVRKLHVGDFLWVARERVQHQPGQPQTPRARELVLEYVVERKRMDDLCGSIVDGRFREQKFRMKRCGLRNRIYLVEDCSFVKHLSLPESTLQQAIVNTQVVDGFFVKRTKDVKESAAYLTIMTRFLQNLYLQKTLLSCRKEELAACSRKDTDSDTRVLLTFSDFNEGAMKNRAQTVKEVFAKQLMQINGISGEKAVAILRHYDSVASLMKAYEECPTAGGREKLLSNIKCGNTQRNLGPALSKTVSQLYCTEGPLC
ncbi:crossover junction endonuclease MUS81 isoform X4 [Carcharodon carcharias]|uniref:crossover junction endonuclease MUS81 isoform X4 n=1 Tax=Carcharodon carcharias TaxID=13397 RepID=UPI001B7F12C4|nr:crossover junction endonuclease MUS81 isoform X4 [Carcharodon carcharias]